jgi:hypothetical protein
VKVWRWLCGSGDKREGELHVCPTMAGRRRSGGHAGAGCLLFYMQPSKAVHATSLRRHIRGMGTTWRRAWAEYCGDAVGRAAAWSARPGQGAHGAWRKGSGEGRRCSARGSHGTRTDRPRPASAGVYDGGRGVLHGARVATPHASTRALAFQGQNVLDKTCSTNILSRFLN